jgi:hypothetical protein
MNDEFERMWKETSYILILDMVPFAWMDGQNFRRTSVWIIGVTDDFQTDYLRE